MVPAPRSDPIRGAGFGLRCFGESDMRWTGLAALGLALALGGCMTAAEQRSADEARCRSYGFRPGAESFANCLMEVDLDRSASRRARLESSGFYGPYWGPWPYRRW